MGQTRTLVIATFLVAIGLVQPVLADGSKAPNIRVSVLAEDTNSGVASTVYARSAQGKDTRVGETPNGYLDESYKCENGMTFWAKPVDEASYFHSTEKSCYDEPKVTLVVMHRAPAIGSGTPDYFTKYGYFFKKISTNSEQYVVTSKVLLDSQAQTRDFQAKFLPPSSGPGCVVDVTPSIETFVYKQEQDGPVKELAHWVSMPSNNPNLIKQASVFDSPCNLVGTAKIDDVKKAVEARSLIYVGNVLAGKIASKPNTKAVATTPAVLDQLNQLLAPHS